MKYDIIGIDGNAFALMGYVARALREQGMSDLVPEMQAEATSGDYTNLVQVCMKYIDMANEKAEEDNDDEEDWEW